MWAGLRKGVRSIDRGSHRPIAERKCRQALERECAQKRIRFSPDFGQPGPNPDPGMAYGQILGPKLDPEFDPEALRGLGAENRVLKVRTNSPFSYSHL